MNLINKLLDNLEKCEDTCGLSMMVRALKGEKKFNGCKGLTCDECKEQANVMLDEWRKELNNNGWVSVEERLPQEYEFVLIQNVYGVMSIAQRLGDSWFNFQGTELNRAVAWQPLPTPYKKES